MFRTYQKIIFHEYAHYQGVLSRKTFWTFAFQNLLVILFLSALSYAVLYWGLKSPDFLVVPYLYILATMSPVLCADARRLHDTGRSGWWVWITILPYLGSLILLVLLLLPAKTTGNTYRESPELTA